MGKYFKAMIFLWRAPAEAKKKAEDELISRLSALPEILREKANQGRGTKRWNVVLAAKVKSVLDNEKRHRAVAALESRPDDIDALSDVTNDALRAPISDLNFDLEWNSFVRSLPFQK